MESARDFCANRVKLWAPSTYLAFTNLYRLRFCPSLLRRRTFSKASACFLYIGMDSVTQPVFAENGIDSRTNIISFLFVISG